MKFFTIVSLAVLASASPVAEPLMPAYHGACCDAKCYKRLEYADSHDMGTASKDCTSYQRTTVTPCPTTKTVHTTSTVTKTATCGHPYAARDIGEDKLIRRNHPAKCTPSHTTNCQPRYATGYCSGMDFASACSCLGVPPKTVTAPQPTITTTECGWTVTTTKTICPTTKKTTTKKVTTTAKTTSKQSTTPVKPSTTTKASTTPSTTKPSTTPSTTQPSTTPSTTKPSTTPATTTPSITTPSTTPSATPSQCPPTTITSTITPTSTITDTSTSVTTTSVATGTTTTYDATSTSTVIIPSSVTTTSGAVTITLTTPIFSTECTEETDATTTTTTTVYTATETVTSTTSVAGGSRKKLRQREIVARSTVPCTGGSTVTATSTAPASTATITSTVTSTSTEGDLSTVDGGTTTVTTTSTGVTTITVPSTITTAPAATTICTATTTITTSTETDTVTESDTTTTTVFVAPAPTSCGNQGLQWAYFNNTAGPNNDATYSNFDPAAIKTQADDYEGVTTTIGGFNTGDQEEQISIYGSPATLNSDYFDLNHRGYIVAQTSGTYTFSISQVDDIAFVWVGPNAYSGYTRDNALLVAPYGNTGGGPGAASATVDLVAGQYYAFRIIFGQGQENADFFAQVTSPDGTVFLSSDSGPSNYLVQYSCDGTTAPQYPPFGQET